MAGELDQGLENVTVAETRLSCIDGAAGELLIAGYPVAELARRATFEECLFLLWEDRLPTSDELASIRDDLASRRTLSESVHDVLATVADQDLPAMDALRIGAAAATINAEGAGSPARDRNAMRDHARRVVAIFPTIIAAYWRYRHGDGPIAPRPDLSHAANYLYMLTGNEPDDAHVRGLETYLNTVIDHGLNASTFTARVIVSTESDIVSAVTGAVGALKGPLHGGAPGPVLEMLLDIHESGDPSTDIQRRLDAGERIMGFGHRVYRVRDPRAAVLESAAEQFYRSAGDAAFFETARDVERIAVQRLADHHPDRRLDTNVEFYTATLLHGLGIPQELFTTTFAVSRVGGWSAHCLEQIQDNRLVRPRARYIGATDRSWMPLEER